MTMLDDLYQDVILEHSRKPSNFRLLADANRSAEGFNPLCGDKVSVGLRVDDSGVISDVGFQGRGCAISKASASMMTESIKDKSVADARKIFESFRSMVTRAPGEEFEAGRRAGGPGDACGGVRVSDQGEVRDAGVAHAGGRAERAG